MPLINEKEIIKKIPVYIHRGMNKGKQAGEIIFEKNKEPYFFVIKNWRRHQLYQSPKHKNTLSISKHILEFLNKFNVKKAIFMIVGFEDKSFYYIILLKDFWNGEKTDYDDVQFRIRINGLTRYYPEQQNIGKFL